MLKGKITGLRAIERTDLQQLRDWRNQPELRQYFREYRELSLENQHHWFERISDDLCNLMFIIEEIDGLKPVGVCGLTRIDWYLRSAELSLYIGDQGRYVDDLYAPDALNLLLAYAFDELNLYKVWAEVYAFDQLKAGLLKQMFAFRQDGVLRANCFFQGEYCDSLILSLLTEERSY